jgi:hypothetical protein
VAVVQVDGAEAGDRQQQRLHDPAGHGHDILHGRLEERNSDAGKTVSSTKKPRRNFRRVA